MRIALINIKKEAYSETFIQAQRIFLKGDITYLWEMGMQSEDGPIMNFSENYIKKDFDSALKNYFLMKKIDVVIAQYGITGVKVLNVCKELSLPLVVHFHGFDAYAEWVLKDYRSRYISLFDYASAIIAVSKDMVKQLKNLGAHIKKIIYAPCGPNEMFFRNAPMFKEKYFISVGRFVDKKAPYLTLAAFREVLYKFPDAKLLMIGDGYLLEVCFNLVQAWKMSNNVEFLGILSPLQIKNVLEKAYCFVQHSVTSLDGDSEGSPVAIFEASASALPVIATKHKGIKDIIIHKKTGFLINELDVDGMAKSMIDLLQNPKKAIDLGQNGREYVKNNFSMESYILKINSIVNDVCT